jgi:uncharacterized protein involved in outer membrane biogenesis
MNKRRAGVALVLLAAAGFGLPALFRAERYRDAIHRGLESSLGRKVDIRGEIAYLLLPRPGFSIQNVYIHEHPSVGVEPFAWVSELEFHVSLAGLLGGRVELAGIRMQEPHINLMKRPDSPWNFQPFLDHALRAQPSGATLPAIEITGGRLNFKSGDTKSVFYLDATDLIVDADSESPGRFGIKFEGEPARTDRSARALGRLSGRGMLNLGRATGAESTIEFSLNSERAPLAEIMTLLQGRSIGMGGFVTSRFRLSGPLSAIAIDGKLELDDFDRFGSLLPAASNWGLQLRGTFDVPGQELRIETAAPPDRPLPLSLRVRATRLLTQPAWAMLLSANRIPLASLRALLSETGYRLPTDVQAEGTVSGALGFSNGRGVQGMISARDGSVPIEGAPPVRFVQAAVSMSGDDMRLHPTGIEIGEKRRPANVEARFHTGTGDRVVTVQTSQVSLADLKPLWRALAPSPLPEILHLARKGVLQGSIRLHQVGDERPRWTADFTATELTLELAELPFELQLASAAVSIRGSAITIRKIDAALGPLTVTGRFDHDPAAKVPARFDMTVREASIVDLETFVGAAFPRRQGLIARTFRTAAPVPSWLKTRRVEGLLRIGSLSAGGFQFEDAAARIEWNGPHLEVRDWKAALGEGEFTGNLSGDLSGPEPSYKARFDVNRFPWQEGTLDTSATVEAAGFGPNVIARLRAAGTFHASDVTLGPGAAWQSASGSFTWTGSAASRLQVRGMEVDTGADTYQGQANSSSEGRLTIDLTSAQKQLRLAGRMSGLQFELLSQ